MTRDDFREASHLFFKGTNDPSFMTNRMMTEWSEAIPYTPLQVQKILSGGCNLSLDVYIDIIGISRVKMHTVLAGGAGGISSSVDIDMLDPVSYPREGSLKINKNLRGQNLGRTLFRNMTEWTMAMNVRQFAFSAGWQCGAATWTKIGAHIDMDERRNPDIRFTLSDLRLELRGRLDIIEDYLAPEDYKRACELCELRNADDLVKLSGMTDVYVPRELAPDLNDIRDHILTHRIRTFYQRHYEAGDRKFNEDTYQQIRYIGNAFEYAAGKGVEQGVPLFDYLTTGMVYPAIIDFDNDAQMDMTGNKLGGWRYAKPVDQRDTGLSLSADYV